MDDLLKRVLGINSPQKQVRSSLKQAFTNFVGKNKFLNSPTPNRRDDPNLTVKQFTRNFAKSAPRQIGSYFKQNVPLVGDLIGRTAEAFTSGAADVGSAAYRNLTRPKETPFSNIRDTAQAVSGVGKSVAAFTPFFQAANIAQKSPSKRFSSAAAGVQEGMVGFDVARDTPKVNSKFNFSGAMLSLTHIEQQVG